MRNTDTKRTDLEETGTTHTHTKDTEMKDTGKETGIPAAAAPVVIVENLRYRYPGQTALALDGISFSAAAGEFVGIIGPNLSGKSTLCHALIGLVPHFYRGAIGGRVVVAGLDVHQTPVAEMSRRVGLVFQNPFTQITGAKLTVYEEVAFGLEYTGVPRKEMIPRIEEALRLLGLWELRDRSPFALSGGQMQRLAIASVLAMKPQVLVMDEPTSQLDPAGTREVFEAAAALSRQGITVIMAEHKVELLAEHSHRLLLLHQGQLVAAGPPREVFAQAARGALPGDPARAPSVTQAAVALGWSMPEGGFPVTLAEGVTAGQARLAAPSETGTNAHAGGRAHAFRLGVEKLDAADGVDSKTAGGDGSETP